MATLSQALNEIANGFWIQEDLVQDTLNEFAILVRERGVNNIYVLEVDDGVPSFDMMGEPTEWQDLYEENANSFDIHTTIKMYNEGFLFDENVMFVRISSLD